MKLIQTVTIKQVLTETTKKQLETEYDTERQQLLKEIDQLHFEMKKLEKTKKYQVGSLRNQFEKEIQKRAEKEKLLDFQIQQLHMLPLGSEIKSDEVQALLEIKEGDRWDSFKEKKYIIIKDGIVDEIR
ncbi:YlqD family protein [Cytobacillus gottheilii]|uniref:YlqD family protein n=1 Tax=Cytobacillus gottheilii TaxID=859144 RepID=A0ABX8FGY5_9BACI|nr:YlqD family protein [Cytobacillus gottheilii]QVY63267.1 YlqD family protein [Cytobacillus gottheilii]